MSLIASDMSENIISYPPPLFHTIPVMTGAVNSLAPLEETSGERRPFSSEHEILQLHMCNENMSLGKRSVLRDSLHAMILRFDALRRQRVWGGDLGI